MLRCISGKLWEIHRCFPYFKYYMAPVTDQFQEWGTIEFQTDDMEMTVTRIKIVVPLWKDV